VAKGKSAANEGRPISFVFSGGTQANIQTGTNRNTGFADLKLIDHRSGDETTMLLRGRIDS
jgi:hypothetical protein